MVWLAIILAAPGDTFGMGHGWDRFAEMGTEKTWAMVFWSVATLGATGISTERSILRLCSVLVLSTAYGCVSLLMLWGAPAGSGSGTYLILAGLGYYLAWRRTHERV